MMASLDGAQRESLLITAEVLAELLGSSRPPVVLDVRWSLTGPPGIEEYHQGHVPGARFCDLDTVLADPGVAVETGGRHPLPDAAAFAADMRALGVSGSRSVVVLDAADSTSAARAWWCLAYFGHPDVRVLDGGFRAWTAAGLPVEVGAPPGPPVAGDFEADPGHLPVIDADGAADLAGRGVLLDARSSERFRGEVEPVDPVAGRIPGATSAPTVDNVDGDGRFLTTDQLARRFDELGAGRGTDSSIGVYCGSGVTAAHEVLALLLTGRPAALYAGSWSQWCHDPDRPIARGEAP